MYKSLSSASLLTFIIFQSIITYLAASKIITFNFAYASVSLVLLVLSGFYAYLSRIEVPDIRAEVKRELQARDKDMLQLKSELSKFSVTRATGKVDNFRF